MNKKDLIEIRSRDKDDYSFILATWLRGLYYGNDWFMRINKDVFMDNYKHVIAKVLEKPKINVNVACLKDEPSVILGYSVCEPATIHWVYVKRAWRNIGIGHDLIPLDTKTATHLTERTYRSELEFNPFIL